MLDWVNNLKWNIQLYVVYEDGVRWKDKSDRKVMTFYNIYQYCI